MYKRRTPHNPMYLCHLPGSHIQESFPPATSRQSISCTACVQTIHLQMTYSTLPCTTTHKRFVAPSHVQNVSHHPGHKRYTALSHVQTKKILLWINKKATVVKEREIPHPMVKSAVRFGAPKSSYGHFSHPAGHGRGKFSSRKTPKMAIRAISRGRVPTQHPYICH